MSISMTRRQCLRQLALGAGTLLGPAALLNSSAADAEATAASTPKLGAQYWLAKEQIIPERLDQVLVQEFFWYGCPHCYAFEPTLAGWLDKKAKDVAFERIPNALGRPIGEVHQRAFYIAETLGISAKTHTPLFDAIHKDHLPMATIEEVRDFYVKTAGVKPEAVISTNQSFLVDSQVSRANDLAFRYGVSGVPTLVVGGRYLTDIQHAGSAEKMPALLDFLVNQIRAEQHGAPRP